MVKQNRIYIFCSLSLCVICSLAFLVYSHTLSPYLFLGKVKVPLFQLQTSLPKYFPISTVETLLPNGAPFIHSNKFYIFNELTTQKTAFLTSSFNYCVSCCFKHTQLLRDPSNKLFKIRHCNWYMKCISKYNPLWYFLTKSMLKDMLISIPLLAFCRWETAEKD